MVKQRQARGTVRFAGASNMNSCENRLGEARELRRRRRDGALPGLVRLEDAGRSRSFQASLLKSPYMGPTFERSVFSVTDGPGKIFGGIWVILIFYLYYSLPGSLPRL
jgi:hypothetical protein